MKKAHTGGEGVKNMGDGETKTTFSVSMDFEHLDEKVQRFIMLRNELAMLAEEIGVTVKGDMLFAEKQ